jgi:hypothetical protein
MSISHDRDVMLSNFYIVDFSPTGLAVPISFGCFLQTLNPLTHLTDLALREFRCRFLSGLKRHRHFTVFSLFSLSRE